MNFEAHRAHLHAVALRMLGHAGEADDAVQEAWLRVQRADATGIDNPGGWLTTVVARICLDILRARRSRREEAIEGLRAEPPSAAPSPEQDLILADAIGPALVVVLETLEPAERLAFVLHDMFAVPFDEIAPILGKTPAAARQLASRARRRLQGRGEVTEPDRARRRAMIEAFLAAARESKFEALLAVLDPDVVARADDAAVKLGVDPEIRGADAVARHFLGKAATGRTIIIDGNIGAAAAFVGGVPRFVIELTFANDRIKSFYVHHAKECIAELDLAPDDADLLSRKS